MTNDEGPSLWAFFGDNLLTLGKEQIHNLNCSCKFLRKAGAIRWPYPNEILPEKIAQLSFKFNSRLLSPEKNNHFKIKFQTKNKVAEKKNNLKIALHLKWLTDVLQKFGVLTGYLESTHFKWGAHENITIVKL